MGDRPASNASCSARTAGQISSRWAPPPRCTCQLRREMRCSGPPSIMRDGPPRRGHATPRPCVRSTFIKRWRTAWAQLRRASGQPDGDGRLRAKAKGRYGPRMSRARCAAEAGATAATRARLEATERRPPTAPSGAFVAHVPARTRRDPRTAHGMSLSAGQPLPGARGCERLEIAAQARPARVRENHRVFSSSWSTGRTSDAIVSDVVVIVRIRTGSWNLSCSYHHIPGAHPNAEQPRAPPHPTLRYRPP